MRTFTLEIKQDTDPDSPRNWDNTGKMICFHKRYELGDKHDLSLEDALKLEAKMKKEGVCLPLYLFDHSGITISTSPFSCPWDSGKVGFIYADKEMIKKAMMVKRVTKAMLEKVKGYLQSEVETYDKFLTGDVYGYVVKNEQGEVEESCWGFYGKEDAESEGKNMMEFLTKKEKTEQAACEACMAL